MNELLAFIGGVLCVGFPGAILYLHTKEARDYFERDRNDKDEQLGKLRAVIAKCGPVTSECREAIGREGGWVKAWMPSARDVMNGHAMLAGRFDLIETKEELP
jgi:hypothetical protein